MFDILAYALGIRTKPSFPLLFRDSEIRYSISETPILLFSFRHDNANILGPNCSLTFTTQSRQIIIQSLEKLCLDLTRSPRRQKDMNEDMLVAAIDIEIVPGEEKLVGFVFGDDLEIIAFEDIEFGDHGAMDHLREEGKELEAPAFEEINANQRHLCA